MNREQAIFGVGGVAFGFMAGFVLAYALMAPTTSGRTPAPPARPIGGPVAPSGESATADGAPHGDVMAVLDRLKGELTQDPDNIEVLLELAHLYLRAGMTAPAVEYLDRVAELEPGNFQGLMYRAMALEGEGETQGAQDLLDRMLAEHPDNWETHYLTAIHFMTGSLDLPRAREAVEQLERLKPGIPVLEDLRRELDHLEGHPGGDEGAEYTG